MAGKEITVKSMVASRTGDPAVMLRQQFVKLCDCGCGQPTLLATQTDARLGHVKGQPLPCLLYHHATVPALETDRFWAKVHKTEACWLWTGGDDGQGYGRFITEGQSVYAHVYSAILEAGPIPEGVDVHHRCENTLCVRPDHLERLTKAEHARRHRVTTHCRRGHEFTPENTHLYHGVRACRTCAALRARERRAAQKEGAA